MAGTRIPRATLGLAAFLAPLVTGPQTGQLFRSDVRTVPVYATVVDRTGALVQDLASSDFQILDNGRKQPLTVFQAGTQPVSIALLLDNSPSVFNASARARALVRAFARRLLPADRACLGTFSHVVTLESDLTNDPERLIRHLGDDAPFPAGTALWDAIDAGREALSHENGRRVVFVVTDAQDNCSRVDAGDARARLERDGVTVYAIGIRGRQGLDSGEIAGATRATGGWYTELNPADDTAAVAARIADEIHQQYALGFSPAALDDKVHRIEVRVNRPGCSTRARRSYFADSHAPLR